jgi:hypothetical protein
MNIFTVVPSYRVSDEFGIIEWPEGHRFGIRAASFADAVSIAADLLSPHAVANVQQRVAYDLDNVYGDRTEGMVYNVLPLGGV